MACVGVSVRADAPKLALFIAQRYVEELWQGYLTLPDWRECYKSSTAACDLNPLKLNLTRGDFALRLMQYGECP